MKNIFAATAVAFFMVATVSACPTRVMNDSNFFIGLADHDLGDKAAENQFIFIDDKEIKHNFLVQPGEEASENITPKEHSFFIYVKQGNTFVKKLGVKFLFCGMIKDDADAEKMSYSDIEQEKIVTTEDGKQWAPGKFKVTHF